MAWLNAVPEQKEGKQPARLSRREQIEAAGMEVLLPRIERGEHWVGYLFEFGPVGKEGPFDADAVLKIAQVLAVEFEPWESRMLIKLSREYQGELYNATKPATECPFPEVAWQYKRARMIQAERNLDAFCK
jgi:hypothetical protein